MQASSSSVRPASPQDAAACVAIYRPYVENTAISWEIDVPTVDEMATRIAGLRATHEWLVLEREDQIIGFAYGQPLKRLATFQWSAETGIYMRADRHRTGGGSYQPARCHNWPDTRNCQEAEAHQKAADTAYCSSDASALPGVFGSVRRTILIIPVVDVI